jgi:DNA helicase-2/ATP-dependent DNA helicase PcrA
MSILEGLNPAQLDAVTTTDGPLLILAGPGSGKTRVIAHRIAYLIEEAGVRPGEIMAVTFTNKAARELRDRVDGLLGGLATHVTLGTFHAVCSRILRIDGERVGVPRGFVIFDDGDQISLMKSAMGELGIDTRQFAPRAVLSAISHAKSELVGPAAYYQRVHDYFGEVVARLYERYQSRLIENNALDFDDIIVRTVELLRTDEAVCQRYRDRYRQVMIDEFQDTNVAQYVLARQLAPPPDSSICVVGDPDQSIYSWRSADIRNILNFEKDYPKAKIVRLEQNYRSSQTILDAAQGIIAANTQRKEKELWTDRGRGDPIVVYEAYNEEEEAAFVAAEVKRLNRSAGVRLGDIAVMYRTNAQSRALEERFVAERVPYRLVGGTRFYERREIKDLVAYLRLVLNPFDSLSLQRVINVPARRIGSRTVEELMNWSESLGVPVYAALQTLAGPEENGQTGPSTSSGQSNLANGQIESGRSWFDDPGVDHGPFAAPARSALLAFLALLNELIAEAPVMTLSRLLTFILEKTRYRDHLMSQFDDGEERWENVQELRNVAAQFDELEPEHALMRFLEDTALMSDVDEYDERIDSVTFITLHAAKGLEFPVVMIIGMEEGLLPHIRSFDDPAQMEEERRLCYVGVTRAKERLYLLRAFRRSLMGQGGHNPPSRFLKDLPQEIVLQAQQTVENAYRRPSPRQQQSSWSTALNGTKTAAAAPPLATYAAGDHVRHLKFGEGVVVACAPTAAGNDQEVTVAFKGGFGVKKLMLSFAPLERLDS